MNTYARLALAAVICWAAGCVPINDYRALEDRFHEQERYVVDNKNKIREMERRAATMTHRAKEQERQIALYRTRLEKSEVLRRRAQEHLRTQPTAVPAAAPKAEEPPRVMGLEVNPETRGLVLESGLLFAPGKAGLKAGGKTMLKKLMTELNKPEFAGRKVCVEGHTDNMPIKRSGHASNWDLSAKRALTVLRYLESQGISAERLSFAGYGPFKPLDHGKGDKALKRNRRVEIVLYED